MHKSLLLALSLFLFISAWAQTGKAKKFSELIASSMLKERLQILAGEEMEGRGTATEGERKAAAYIEKQFAALELKPVVKSGYRMPFTVYKDSMTHAGITVNGISYHLNTDFSTAFPYSLEKIFTVPLMQNNHTCEINFSEAVFAGYGIEDEKYSDYKDLDVAGKLVAVYEGEPRRAGVNILSGSQKKSGKSFPFVKINTATKKGAAALLIIQKNFPLQKEQSVVSNLMKSPYPFHHGVNTWFISENAAKEIFKDKYAQILNGVKEDSIPASVSSYDTEISLSYFERSLPAQSNNVLAVLEGTDKKDEYVFIMAHYDHLGKKDSEIYYGADDNASGTACLLSIAEAFSKAKKAGNAPGRSIVFAAFSGEENGLWGSDVYTSNPAYPLDKVSAALNMDMVGRIGFDYGNDNDSANYIYITGTDKLSSDLLNINEQNNKYTKLKLDYKYNNLKDENYFFYRSDHFNFARKGVPVLFYSDGMHADYHEPTDTPDKINYRLLARRTQLIFYTAWDIANMKRLLVRDKTLQE